MPKRATTLPLTLAPRPAGAQRPTRWLFDALRAEILEGRLHPGARLPATRDLAAQYRISRGTVVDAFERLRAEGYLVGSVGSGTRVNTVLPEDLLQAPRAAARRPRPVRPPARPLAAFARAVVQFRGYEPRSLRAFRANQPALDRFPITLWAQVSSRRLRRATHRAAARHGAAGLPPAAGGGGRLSPHLARRATARRGRWPSYRACRRRSTSSRAWFSTPATGCAWRTRATPARRVCSRRWAPRSSPCRWTPRGSCSTRGAWRGARLAYVTPRASVPARHRR